MFCKKCGKEIEDNKLICDECAALEEAQDVEVEVIEADCEEPCQEEVVVEKDNSRKFGIASLVLGMCALFIPFLNTVTAVLAIVFGAKGRKSDLGIVGLVAGIIYIVNSIIVTLMLLFVYALYFIIIVGTVILANIPV